MNSSSISAKADGAGKSWVPASPPRVHSCGVVRCKKLRQRAGRYVALLAMLLAAGATQAQVQRSFNNLGFELPELTTNGCRVYINAAQVPGWQTTHPNNATENSGGCVVAGGLGTSPGPILELWQTPRDSSSGGTVTAPEGNQIAELNAVVASRIYQNVCLINGERVNWRFSHRGRASASVRDVAEMKVGASSTVIRVGTTNNGAFDTPVVSQGTANAPLNIPGNATWVRYTGDFTYTGATGVTNLGFEAISAQGGASNGNLLDDIQIQAAPFVEFTQPSSSTPESATSNVPTLRVNGTVFTSFDVTVSITGGTAALGTDYTTPGNSTTLTVSIPAGNYDGSSSGSLFALPVTVVNDALSEGNETINFAIAPPGGTAPAYQLRSSITCGGAVQTTWIYTIVDDDAGIALSKNAAAPVAVAGQPTQFDIVYTIVASNPGALLAANYSLIDSPGLDADASILSAGFSLNGGATTALAGSGPWTLQPQWRNLAAGATDTYVLTVRINTNRGGSAANDVCASPSTAGAGLHNSATATVQAVAGANPGFSASACRNTPTPVWVTLRKQLPVRVLATDQFQVRLYSGGIVMTSATTTGTAVPATASTGLVVMPAGNTVQFEEALKASGTGTDQAPANYQPQLTCTNAAAGSATVLPGGAGTALSTRQQWAEFSPAAGDDLDCVIVNNTNAANLTLSKTNTPALGPDDQAGDSVLQGAVTTYDIVVRNNGPVAANNAVVRDPAAPGLSACALGTPACSASGGASCPAAGNAAGQLSMSNLQGSGVSIPVFPLNGAVTFKVACTVQ